MAVEKCRVTDFYGQLNPLYKRLLAGFSDLQRILNYEKTSQRDMPKMVAKFLHYMQENHVNDPVNITEGHLQNYYSYLEQRPNRLRGGSISKAIERCLEPSENAPGIDRSRKGFCMCQGFALEDESRTFLF